MTSRRAIGVAGGLRLAACVVAAAAAVASAASVQSRFTSDRDGWNLIGLTTHPSGGSPSVAFHAINWTSTGGNPDGYIYGVDDLSWNDTFYFSAPKTFRGDKSAYVGGTFAYDVRNTGSGAYVAGDDASVILVKTSGGKALYQSLVPAVGAAFNAQSFTLAPGNGWRVNGSTAAFADATASDFADVLGDLGAIYVLGDYRDGVDTASLDNVVLTSAAPEPGTTALLALATAAALGPRRRRVTRPSPACSRGAARS